MEVARSIREDYLHQNAFHEIDTYTSLNKQLALLRIVLTFADVGLALLEKGIEIQEILALKIRERIAQAKFIPEDKTGGIH